MSTYTLTDIADLQLVVVAAFDEEQAKILLLECCDERFLLYQANLQECSRFLVEAHVESVVGECVPQVLVVLAN